ncbi:MAG TPA: hypothetical protein VFO19_10325 [Vicinamibacterales bacterium]|nr:hypothetical protein [Vicinamibacterales bacterium]
MPADAAAFERHPGRAVPLRWVTAAAIAWAGVVTWTAWASDDAFITLRTVENLLDGAGPRWNLIERVQAYTHPLWMLVLAAGTAIGRDPYYTAMLLSILASAGAMAVVAGRLALSAVHVAMVLTAAAASQAFVDYSSSGLENPLTHLLLAAYVAAWLHRDGRGGIRLLTLIGSLCLLTRLDLALLIGPSLAVRAWQCRPIHRAAIDLAIGGLPLVAWEAFSLVYYGLMLPNTAYAKLATGIPAGVLLSQGLRYFENSIAVDPLTLATIGLAMLAPWQRSLRGLWPLSLGLLLSLVYVAKVGGDFMSGRFFSAPFMVALCIAARMPLPRSRVSAAGLALVAAVLAAAGFRPQEVVDGNGISDERRIYSRGTRLVTQRELPLQSRSEVRRGLDWRDDPERVAIWGFVGMVGYYTRPDLHIIDPNALTDPLLSHLPAEPGWRIGHFTRQLPPGYAESVLQPASGITDPRIAEYDNVIRTLTRGPIWTLDRLRIALRFNAGGYDHLLER